MGRPRLNWATKFSTISRLTGASPADPGADSNAAIPYSLANPAPPNVCTAWSTRANRDLGRGVLGHVGRLARAHVVAGVVQGGRLLHHQPGLLELDLDLGQRVGQALMGADRLAPHRPLLGVLDRRVQRVPGQPDRAGRRHDPLGVEPGEQLGQRRVLLADQGVGRHPDVVEEEQELAVRMTMSMSIARYSKPGASVGTMNSAGLSLPVRASAVRPTTSTASARSTPD